MSAFIGILHETVVILATDTLARHAIKPTDEDIRPLNFSSKVFHLPQFKSVFAVTGFQLIAFSFYKLLTERYIGKDICSIVEVEPTIFLTQLEKDLDQLSRSFNKPISEKATGTIYLYGLNQSTGKFEGYYLPINKGVDNDKWIKCNYVDNNAIVMSPGVENYWEKADMSNGIYEFTKNLMIVQKQEDDQRPVVDRAGIGGQIVYTELGLTQNGNISITSTISHTFPDYDYQFEIMMMNRHNND